MIKIERIVKNVANPHEWVPNGLTWRCKNCGAIAAEFDDFGHPDPYGKIVYRHGDMECVEATCDELSVIKVMEG